MSMSKTPTKLLNYFFHEKGIKLGCDFCKVETTNLIFVLFEDEICAIHLKVECVNKFSEESVVYRKDWFIRSILFVDMHEKCSVEKKLLKPFKSWQLTNVLLIDYYPPIENLEGSEKDLIYYE